MTTITNNLFTRAQALKLHGIIAHWSEIETTSWIESLITWEETERSQRSLEQRFKAAKLGHFKPLAQFDWNWPTKCDRQAIEELMQLEFLKDATNIIFAGPSGVGKTTFAHNIGHHAVMKGHTVLLTTASHMLNELAALDSDLALRRRLKHYTQPNLLIIDEVGYLSYSNRHADLFFEIISQRYEKKPILITTNISFKEWGDIFPNASCVVALIDRLVHRSEIIGIEGPTFRLKEATEKNAQRKKERAKRKANSDSKKTQEKKS